MEHLENKTITSLEVAEMIGKEHKELLRDIRRYAEQFNESKIALVDFFSDSSYEDKKGEVRPCYHVTKKGCEFIAHKLTGTKGTEFTAKYINRFHEMEEHIYRPIGTFEQIKLLAQGNVELDQKIDSVKKDLQDFKQDMPLLGVEESLITTAVKKRGLSALGGKTSAAYQNASLRGKVYSDIHNEVKRQFGVSTYKAIKRSKCEDAISIIDEYELPLCLAEEIDAENAQISLEV